MLAEVLLFDNSISPTKLRHNGIHETLDFFYNIYNYNIYDII